MIPIWSIYFYGDTNSVLLLRIYYNICLDIIVYHHSGIDRKLRHYILIICAKTKKKKKAPIFYAIRSLAVSDFIFLVLSMISWIFILTKVNNTVLYFTTGIIVTFSLVDFTFNVYPWKCSINPHLFKDEKTSINDCEPCQYQEQDVFVYLWYCSAQWSLTILFNFYLDMKKLLNFNSFCTCKFYSFM